MEQYVIIFGIVATGCITTFVQYVNNHPKHEQKKDMAKIGKFYNALCKSLSAACVIFALIPLVLGLTGDLEKAEVVNYVASFLAYALIFLVFSFSSSPKIIDTRFSK